MATTIPAGLGTTLGISTPESSYGTETDPTHWLYIEPTEKFALKKNVLETKVLHGSVTMLGSQRVVPTISATGGFTMNVVDVGGMGQVFQAMFGSSTSAVLSGSAYQQIHQISQTSATPSVTIQKNVPEIPSGTIVPFTYPGFKISEWEFTLKRGAQLQLNITGVAQYEDTTYHYVAPSFVTPRTVYHFGMSPGIVVSPTIATSSGVMSITSGAPFGGIVSSFTLKGTRKLAEDRYNIGSLLWANPLDNDYMEITGEIELEFNTLADFYNYFAVSPSSLSETPISMGFTLTQPTAITGSYYPTFQLILPQLFFDGASPTVDTPGMVQCKAAFHVEDDGQHNICQLGFITADNALSPSNF